MKRAWIAGPNTAVQEPPCRPLETAQDGDREGGWYPKTSNSNLFPVEIMALLCPP